MVKIKKEIIIANLFLMSIIPAISDSFMKMILLKLKIKSFMVYKVIGFLKKILTLLARILQFWVG